MNRAAITLLTLACCTNIPGDAAMPSPTADAADADRPSAAAETGEQAVPHALPARSGPDRAPLARGSWPARFDLSCEGRGRVVQESFELPINHNPQQWDASQLILIDLEAMQHCTPMACKLGGMGHVHAADAESLVLRLDDTFDWHIRRSDLAFTFRRSERGNVEVETGTCRIEPFSGFPDHQVTTG